MHDLLQPDQQAHQPGAGRRDAEPGQERGRAPRLQGDLQSRGRGVVGRGGCLPGDGASDRGQGLGQGGLQGAREERVRVQEVFLGAPQDAGFGHPGGGV